MAGEQRPECDVVPLSCSESLMSALIAPETDGSSRGMPMECRRAYCYTGVRMPSIRFGGG
jgi:hypothetical protein